MYNQQLGNLPENLVKTEYNDKLYKDKGFDDNSSFGYRSFAIENDAGIYYFKIGEWVEDPEGFMNEIVDLFTKNIKQDK